MNSLRDNTEKARLWRLTAEQRAQIYKEEKQRIENSSPALSNKTKIIAGIYLLGCLLLYFGVTNAVFTFWSTHRWKLEPEPKIFESLIDSAICCCAHSSRSS